MDSIVKSLDKLEFENIVLQSVFFFLILNIH